MSRFIRTKEGIYDTSKGLYTPSIKMWAIGFVTIYDDQILKEADTIDELCDLFVYSHTIFKKINEGEDEDEVAVLIKPLSRDINFYGQGIAKEQIERGVYGCIWTDKGLIYIAKMDAEGKLILL